MENEKLMTWDLDVLYSGADEWEKDFAALENAAEKFYSFKGHLADSPAALKAAIEAGDDFERLAEKNFIPTPICFPMPIPPSGKTVPGSTGSVQNWQHCRKWIAGSIRR